MWSADASYLEGTKIVWHHNVYEAKWWTSGDLPDDPVLSAYETPWQLIGPVLPGEKPVEQVTLPTGTYPSWSGTKQYDTGARVLFDGVPYQAKWWNTGDSPEAPRATRRLAVGEAQGLRDQGAPVGAPALTDGRPVSAGGDGPPAVTVRLW